MWVHLQRSVNAAANRSAASSQCNRGAPNPAVDYTMPPTINGIQNYQGHSNPS
jgi:hypothetical protein